MTIEERKERNKLFFEAYINFGTNSEEMKKLVDKYKLAEKTIINICYDYYLNSANKHEKFLYKERYRIESFYLDINIVKQIYNDFIKHNWDENYIWQKAGKYDINIKTLKKDLELFDIYYSNNKMKAKIKAINNAKPIYPIAEDENRNKLFFEAYINFGTKSEEMKKLVDKYKLTKQTIINICYNYYLNSANEHEKFLYQERYRIESFYLDINIVKQIYDECKKNNWTTLFIQKKAKEYELSYDSLKKDLELFATYYLDSKIEKKKIQDSQELTAQQKYYIATKDNYYGYKMEDFIKLYKQIVACDTIDEKIALCLNYNLTRTELKKKIHHLACVKSKDSKNDYNKIYDIIYKQFQDYFDYLDKVKKEKFEQIKKENEKKAIVKAFETIITFIQSDLDESEFIKLIKTTSSEFSIQKRLVKNNNPTLYKQYKDYLLKKENDLIEENIDKINSLINFLNFGINTQNGDIRDFDVIDYYMYISTDPKIIKKAVRILFDRNEIDLGKYKAIITFLGQNTPIKNHTKNHPMFIITPMNIENLLNRTYERNLQKDEKGNYIPGTGRTITYEEKIFINDFFKKYNIPLTTRTWNIAINRTFNNDLKDLELSQKRAIKL